MAFIGPQDYAGAVVVVTGASSGIGRAIAHECAKAGPRAVVVNFATSAEAAEETAAAVCAAGAEAILARGDVSRDEDCAAIVRTAAGFGRIDALFNNAGATKFVPDHADLDRLSSEDFQRIYGVNLVGAYQMIRAARELLEAGTLPGAVVNTASIAGVTGQGSSVAYSASKGALINLTKSLARALAPKIRINALCPGFVDTAWFAKGRSEAYAEAARQRARQTTPLQTAPTPEEVSHAALFLGSPKARHITGETLLVDSGLHLGATGPR